MLKCKVWQKNLFFYVHNSPLLKRNPRLNQWYPNIRALEIPNKNYYWGSGMFPVSRRWVGLFRMFLHCLHSQQPFKFLTLKTQECTDTFLKGGYFELFSDTLLYFYSTLLLCRPSDSTVSEDTGIEPRTVATLVLAVRRSNHSAWYPPIGWNLAECGWVTENLASQRKIG